MDAVKGAKSAAIWVTVDSIPTNDNNNSYDLVIFYELTGYLNLSHMIAKMVLTAKSTSQQTWVLFIPTGPT